jgi:hypothetical protein
MVTPHLRFGRPGSHDPRREAFCALVGHANAAFVYSEEDPATFSGTEPTDLPAIEEGTRRWCACETTTTTTASSTTTTTLAARLRVVECLGGASVNAEAELAVGTGSDSCSDSAAQVISGTNSAITDEAGCVATANGASSGGSGRFSLSVTGAIAAGDGTVTGSGLVASTQSTANAASGTRSVASAGTRVSCTFRLDAPASFTTNASVSAQPANSFSTMSVRLKLRFPPATTIAFAQQEGGETQGTFPASGTLAPGFYDLVVSGGAAASPQASTASTASTFSLDLGPAP